MPTVSSDIVSSKFSHCCFKRPDLRRRHAANSSNACIAPVKLRFAGLNPNCSAVAKNALGDIRKSLTDAAGRTIQSIDALSKITAYTYDAAGNQLSVRDPNSVGQDCVYDGLGRDTSCTDTASDATSQTYDKAGNKITATDAKSETTTYTFDARGRQIKQTDRLGGETEFAYTARGELSSLTDAEDQVTSYTYDDGGRMLTSTYNNSVVETRAYNNDNTLSSISYTGASLGNLTYAWDDNKNKTSEAIAETMSNYGFTFGSSGYDDEDRLINWERDDNNLDQSWDLSLVGDWDEFTENASAQTRTHGPTHEILTAASQSIQHDVKGNQTAIPAVLRATGSTSLVMKWDFDNHLASADIDNDSTDDIFYEFDALGRRVARDDGTNDTIFVQSGQQTVADYPSGTAATSPTYTYLYASYIDEPIVRVDGSTLEYYHRTQQYSITAVTNSSGTVVERYAYDAYGNLSIFDGSGTARTTTAIDNRYTYTGREYDEDLGLYHYRARMYNAVAGRFCSRDPIGYIDGIHLYGRYFSLGWLDFSGTSVVTSKRWENAGGVGTDSTKVTSLYCEASERYPLNGWLSCACDVSGDIDSAIQALEALVLVNQIHQHPNSQVFINYLKSKIDWFRCTRLCMQERWFEAVQNIESGSGLSQNSEWKKFCKKCKLNSPSLSCCQKQVDAEQGQLSQCMNDECGEWEWGNTFPINVIPGFEGDFNDLETRIEFGYQKCCNSSYYPEDKSIWIKIYEILTQQEVQMNI